MNTHFQKRLFFSKYKYAHARMNDFYDTRLHFRKICDQIAGSLASLRRLLCSLQRLPLSQRKQVPSFASHTFNTGISPFLHQIDN